MESNIKLIIAYDGTNYHGFQRQKNALTVQQVLEDRLAPIFGHELKLIGAARTDSGVHAYGQVVNFHTKGSIPCSRIPAAAKGLLPKDIVVKAAEQMPHTFHARYDALGKIYLYRLYSGEAADPFLRNYAWHVAKRPLLEKMNDAAELLEGTHDFSAFQAAGGAQVSPVRTIFSACCYETGGLLEFKFWGNGFLYHMVRNLVGTLVDVGMGRLTKDEFAGILAGRDRNLAGITAPAQGLYLKEVFYEKK
jgi:tRNA pseudouridine38-40 synthase